MTWTDLTTNVTLYIGRLKARFPLVDEASLQFVSEPGKLIDHVAQRHDLTPSEAREEIENWLYVEGLARQASELRAS